MRILLGMQCERYSGCGLRLQSGCEHGNIETKRASQSFGWRPNPRASDPAAIVNVACIAKVPDFLWCLISTMCPYTVSERPFWPSSWGQMSPVTEATWVRYGPFSMDVPGD